MPAELRIEDHGAVRVITFDRAAKKNAFTVAMYAGMVDAFEVAAADAAVRAVVLTGDGDTFCAGNDLADFADTPPAGAESPVFHFLAALVDFPKPLIAAVNGAAIGIGTTMLLHCDLVYAAEGVAFHMPFVHLGLSAEGASSVLLPRVAGLQRASELLLFGDRFAAARAKEVGIVNEVVAPAMLRDVALDRAAQLAGRPPRSVAAIKGLLRHEIREAAHAALSREAEVFLERLASPEAQAAIRAFLERRRPSG